MSPSPIIIAVFVALVVGFLVWDKFRTKRPPTPPAITPDDGRLKIEVWNSMPPAAQAQVPVNQRPLGV
jgi:hypothetical protein